MYTKHCTLSILYPMWKLCWFWKLLWEHNNSHFSPFKTQNSVQLYKSLISKIAVPCSRFFKSDNLSQLKAGNREIIFNLLWPSTVANIIIISIIIIMNNKHDRCALDSGTLTTDTEIIRMSHCGSFYFDDK